MVPSQRTLAREVRAQYNQPVVLLKRTRSGASNAQKPAEGVEDPIAMFASANEVKGEPTSVEKDAGAEVEASRAAEDEERRAQAERDVARARQEHASLGTELAHVRALWVRRQAGDPSHDKALGDGAFTNKDFAAAVEAYGRALEVNPAFYQCFSNRAACNLAMREYSHAVRDCCHALALMDADEAERQNKVASRAF